MSISSIISTGLSALQSSQAGMKVSSQNIANANTAGYVRTEINYAPLTQYGGGAGVEVSSIRRAADKFLATAAFIAEANSGAATARSSLLARAQNYFGDPTSSSSMFASIDQIWTSITDLQVDPSSSLARDQVVSAIETAFATISQTASSLQSLIAEADERIGNTVNEMQSLVDRISDLNNEIQLTKRAGADATGVENTQSALIDQLAKLVDLRVEAKPDGGVFVRTSGGALLVGASPAQLDYTPNGASFASHGVIEFNTELGTNSNLEPYILGGQLSGLLKARDQDLPALAEALGGYSAALADQLNRVHNENSSSPAVSEMVGRQTGLLSSDALSFTGNATLGITDSSGNLAKKLQIDFDAGTIVTEYPAGAFTTTNFTNGVGAFATALDTAMGIGVPAGNASFSGGKLSLDVGSGGGLVVQQDSADPSARAGRGFAHFFGLNDLVSRPTPTFFEAGVSGGDLNGLTAGGQLSFLVKDSSGRIAAERTVTITPALAAGTWNDLVSALNTNGTGLGEFATFSINSDGRMVVAPRSGFTTQFTDDSTQRGSTGVSVSSLFGLAPAATAGRASETSVASAISSDPGRLAVARPDLTSAVGARIVELGDNRGAAALAAARDTTRDFPAAGALSAQSTTLALYASRLGGAAGRMASEADHMATGAAAVAAAATDRRSQVESVTVDEELLRMTTYQNSYAAAARIIQAANDMFDILFSIGSRA
ncbi:MAG: flagellar hook-associated protein FlgK [Caulobacterales bacterium]